MTEKMSQALGKNVQVKLIRTQRETRLLLVLKGTPEATDDTLERLVKAIC